MRYFHQLPPYRNTRTFESYSLLAIQPNSIYTPLNKLRSLHDDTNLTIRGQNFAVKRNNRLLGLIFDEKLQWKQHSRYLSIRYSKILNAVRSVEDIRWRAEKGTEAWWQQVCHMESSTLDHYGIVISGAFRKGLTEGIPCKARKTIMQPSHTKPARISHQELSDNILSPNGNRTIQWSVKHTMVADTSSKYQYKTK